MSASSFIISVMRVVPGISQGPQGVRSWDYDGRNRTVSVAFLSRSVGGTAIRIGFRIRDRIQRNVSDRPVPIDEEDTEVQRKEADS